MPVTLQELRPDVVAKATAFATDCGCALQPGRLSPGLSLLATEGETIVAAMLCIEMGHRHRLELAYPTPGIDPELRRLLVDKALMKLHAAGVRTCDLITNGAASDPGFWGSVSWIGQALGDAA